MPRLRVLMLTVALGVVGCSSTQSPVLYPNAHLQQVGQEQAERDICLREKGYEVVGWQ